MNTPRSRTRRSFVCKESGCGRSFLRQEHLQRHRLNHQPAEIFSCDICPKSFVRQDLYRRHKSRHERGMFFRNTGGIVSANPREQDPMPAVHVAQMQMQDDCLTVAEEAATRPENEFLQSKDDGLNSVWPGCGQTPSSQDDLNWFFEQGQGINDLLGPPIAQFYPELSLDIQDPTLWQSENQGIRHLSHAGKLDSFLDATTNHDSDWAFARSNLLDALGQLDMQALQSPFFDTANLKMFHELYFQHYHPHFPIVHRATHSVVTCDPLLLIAILDLGSTMATDETLFHLGQQVHRSLRLIIINSGMFEPPIPLWCLQALLLVQAYGKMISSRKNYEMAHIFHGAILTMMKRGSIYLTASTSHPPRPNESLQASWHRWISEESWRRTAFFAFAMDAQHACVFGHSPVLSVSDMRIALPCQETLWDSTSPEAWQELNNPAKPAPLFLPTLKSLLRGGLVPTSCSEYARFLLLHGLMSLQTHLQAGSRLTLGIEAGKLHNRSNQTHSHHAESAHPHSYTNSQPHGNLVQIAPSSSHSWASTMDTAITTWSSSLFSLQPSLCLEAARPLYRMTQITLHVSVLDIHTLAMDPPFSSLPNAGTGKGTGSADFAIPPPNTSTATATAQTRMQRWANTDSSREACRYALLLVQETMFNGKRYSAREDNIAPRPWCLYIAVLTLWVYGLVTEGPAPDVDESGAEEYMIRMTSALQKGSPRGLAVGANQTRGLIRAARDALTGCRWELLQEAHLVLRRLVGETVLDSGGSNKSLI